MPFDFDQDSYYLDVQSTMCCGLGEIGGIQDDTEKVATPKRVLIEFRENKAYDYPFVIFTAADQADYVKTAGTKLARFIRAHKLGTVRQTRWKRNPNSGNNVQIFLWEPNYVNLKHFDKPSEKRGKPARRTSR